MCMECSLWHFNIIPSTATLRDLLENPAVATRWAGHSDRPAFKRAREVLHEFFSRGGSVLDVGAHTGGFLDTLDSNWRKTALEPMRCASEQRRDEIEMLSGFLEEKDIGLGKYEVVTAFDVFEHLADPDLACGRIARALRPGGLLVIETGNSSALSARILGGAWYYMNFLEHFQAFNIKALSHLFGRYDLEVIRWGKVFQTTVSPAVRVRTAFSLAAFLTITAGGRTGRLWRSLNRTLRPDSAAAPPSSIALDQDHIFVVARKASQQ